MTEKERKNEKSGEIMMTKILDQWLVNNVKVWMKQKDEDI